MNVGIALETDVEAYGRSHLIDELSDHLTKYFSDKSYGQDIEKVDIGVICKRVRPGFEAFSKVRKPKYVEREVVDLIGGGTREYTNVFGFDVRFEESAYKDFISANEEIAVAALLSTLMESISNLELLPKRIKNFDKEKFKTDFEKCLQEWGRVG